MKNKNELNFDEYDVIDEEDLYIEDDDDNEYSGLVEDNEYMDDNGYEGNSFDINSDSEEVYHLLEGLKQVDEWLFNARQYLANETDSHYDSDNVEEDMQFISDARRKLYQIASLMTEISENYNI